MAKGTILRVMLIKKKETVFIALALLVLLFIGIVYLAPAEKTLGESVRLIYAHAAFTRAGMFGVYFAGLLGVIVLLTNDRRWQSLAQTVTWVALGLFLIGGLFSILAQQATWGGTPLAEPRNRTSMTVVALALIVLIVNMWLPWIRVRGLLYSFLAWYVAWAIPRTPLLLHPENAGGSSPSLWIRLTFPTLTMLALLLGFWIVWYFEKVRGYERQFE